MNEKRKTVERKRENENEIGKAVTKVKNEEKMKSIGDWSIKPEKYGSSGKEKRGNE